MTKKLLRRREIDRRRTTKRRWRPPSRCATINGLRAVSEHIRNVVFEDVTVPIGVLIDWNFRCGQRPSSIVAAIHGDPLPGASFAERRVIDRSKPRRSDYLDGLIFGLR